MPTKRNVDLEMWLQKVYGGGAMNYEIKNPVNQSGNKVKVGVELVERLTRKIVLGPHELLLSFINDNYN